MYRLPARAHQGKNAASFASLLTTTTTMTMETATSTVCKVRASPRPIQDAIDRFSSRRRRRLSPLLPPPSFSRTPCHLTLPRFLSPVRPRRGTFPPARNSTRGQGDSRTSAARFNRGSNTLSSPLPSVVEPLRGLVREIIFSSGSCLCVYIYYDVISAARAVFHRGPRGRDTRKAGAKKTEREKERESFREYELTFRGDSAGASHVLLLGNVQEIVMLFVTIYFRRIYFVCQNHQMYRMSY